MIMRKETKENLTEEISIGIPKETLEALVKVAKKKDLPLKALLKFYVGQGLRNGLSQEEVTELALKRLKSRKGSQASSEVDLAA